MGASSRGAGLAVGAKLRMGSSVFVTRTGALVVGTAAAAGVRSRLAACFVVAGTAWAGAVGRAGGGAGAGGSLAAAAAGGGGARRKTTPLLSTAAPIARTMPALQ